eukprot:1181270-Pyramimonas_sp.AAC.1
MGGNEWGPLSEARRDKHLMATRLSQEGVRAPRQLYTSDWDQVMGVLLFHPTRGGAPEAPSTEAPLLLVQHNNTTLPAVDTTPPAVDTTPPAVKRSQV